ncbi:MAG: hypothetical protein DWQ07_21450 [Chloroflexi bacterium]|nr:MAG: hypothetical protein DWQ07_21450 [Chloroflexota bacterium]
MILLIIFCLFFSACSVLAPQPTATPTPTNTAIPTNTPQPTATPEPTATETPPPPTDTPEPAEVALDPQGTPDTEWNGIPIMPDAVAGEGDSSSYMFRVNATPEEVIVFYDRELGNLGYSRFAIGDTENDSILIFYQREKDLQIVSISAIPQDDGSVIVLIV